MLLINMPYQLKENFDRQNYEKGNFRIIHDFLHLISFLIVSFIEPLKALNRKVSIPDVLSLQYHTPPLRQNGNILYFRILIRSAALHRISHHVTSSYSISFYLDIITYGRALLMMKMTSPVWFIYLRDLSKDSCIYSINSIE